ncbi:MAG: hypothetical protein P4L87_05290 [Formivibrio sp.]|nr:hypothetical protein [Formivibrio sp.]
MTNKTDELNKNISRWDSQIKTKPRSLAYCGIVFAVLFALFGTLYNLHVSSYMPENYFPEKNIKKISGSAAMWRAPKGVEPRIRVVRDTGGESFFDCFAITDFCAKYSVGQSIGHIDIYGFHLTMSAYWPDSIIFNGENILSSEKSRMEYAKYRSHSISITNWSTYLSLLLFFPSLALILFSPKTINKS